MHSRVSFRPHPAQRGVKHIILLLHYNLKLPDVCVGIVDNGWIYRTKIDPISILHPYPSFLTFLSNGHPYIFFFHFKEMFLF